MLGLLLPSLMTEGYPVGNEIFVHLMPALHARFSLLAGELPIYTDLFFSGRYQFANPLWFGWYPFAWPLYVPGLPLKTAIYIVVAPHLLAAPAIAYYYSQKTLPYYFAVPFAYLWLMPITVQAFGGHLEKLFAWPWLVLLVWQLRPSNLTERPRRAGYIMGFCGGMMFLAAGNYYFIYGLLIAVPFALAYWHRDMIKGAVLAGLIGTPRLVTVVALLLEGTSRPEVGFKLTLPKMVWLLSGLHLIESISIKKGLIFPGFAVIGLPALWLGYRSVKQTDWGDISGPWRPAAVVVIAVGTLIATGSPVIYTLPGSGLIRTAGRANIIIALMTLLFVWVGLRYEWANRHSVIRVAVAGLLLSSVAMAGVAFATLDMMSSQPTTFSDTVMTEVDAAGCDEVWISHTPAWSSSGDYTRFRPERLSFEATERGIAVRAGHVGHFGQEWSLRDEGGAYQVDVLVTPVKLPDGGSVDMSTMFDRKPVDTLPVSDTSFLQTVSTPRDQIHLYEIGEGC
ncbi:hypothetical protein [Haloarcula pelagica]|uniref:hypothetical protein n=2 Tax=Haloarcula TaxID=2237 RepID=UPI0036D42055